MSTLTEKSKGDLNKVEANIEANIGLSCAKTAVVCTIRPVLEQNGIKIDDDGSRQRIKQILENDAKVIIGVGWI